MFQTNIHPSHANLPLFPFLLDFQQSPSNIAYYTYGDGDGDGDDTLPFLTFLKTFKYSIILELSIRFLAILDAHNSIHIFTLPSRLSASIQKIFAT